METSLRHQGFHAKAIPQKSKIACRNPNDRNLDNSDGWMFHRFVVFYLTIVAHREPCHFGGVRRCDCLETSPTFNPRTTNGPFVPIAVDAINHQLRAVPLPIPNTDAPSRWVKHDPWSFHARSLCCVRGVGCGQEGRAKQ